MGFAQSHSNDLERLRELQQLTSLTIGSGGNAIGAEGRSHLNMLPLLTSLDLRNHVYF